MEPTTSNGGLSFATKLLPTNQDKRFEEISKISQTQLSSAYFKVLYLSHTLPTDPNFLKMNDDLITWYLLSYNHLQEEESDTSQDYSNTPSEQRSSGGGNSQFFGDDDESWKHKDGSFELIPDGLSEKDIMSQFHELDRKTQRDFMESVSEGTFENRREYEKEKVLNMNDEVAQEKLKELQELAKRKETQSAKQHAQPAPTSKPHKTMKLNDALLNKYKDLE